MLKVKSFFPPPKKSAFTNTDYCQTTSPYSTTDNFDHRRRNINKNKLDSERLKILQQTKINTDLKSSYQPKGRNLNNKKYLINNKSNYFSHHSIEQINKKLMENSSILCKTLDQQKQNQCIYFKNLCFKQSLQKSRKPKTQTNQPDLQCKNMLEVKLLKMRHVLKQKKSTIKLQRLLSSSNLGCIYNDLYNTYEAVPFNQQETDETDNESIPNPHSVICIQPERKERKSYELKQLSFEKNLRKEIKSLTRDTDHILSLEFKDIRETNNNR